MTQLIHTVTPLLPGLLRLTSEAHSGHHPVNGYAVATADGWLVVDPHRDATPAALEEAGVASVCAVLVTHLQREHIDGCEALAQAYADGETGTEGGTDDGLAVYVPAGDAYLAAGQAAYEARETTWQSPWNWDGRGNFEGHMGGALNERPPGGAIELAGVIEAGTELTAVKLGESEELNGVQVVATPGHGKHAVTYVVEIDGQRVGLCGDAICGEGQVWNWFDLEWDYGPYTGMRTLISSAKRLRALELDVLLPAHGPAIEAPGAALDRLIKRLEAVLAPAVVVPAGERQRGVINFEEVDAPVNGFRAVLPNVIQWRAGNMAVVRSKTGCALVIDDGLCGWEELPEREAAHRAVIEAVKREWGIERVDLIIPTHYHGDHTEGIEWLRRMEGAKVVALDTVAEPIEHPERFNLACPLPWYGAAFDVVKIDERVASGTTFSWHEYEIEIFQLGGQTWHHSGIEMTIDGQKVLFVGDAVAGWWAGSEPVLCYNDAEPAERGWSFAVDRMIEREPDVLVCGHGAAIKHPGTLLKYKRQAWDVQLERYAALNPREDARVFFDPFVQG